MIGGGLISAGVVGLDPFERTLLIDFQNENGSFIASTVITLASKLGKYRIFKFEMAYTIDSPQTGRVLVRDPSPAFPGDLHLSSVDVRLEP
ncbi:MAG: hypothetical protein IBX69_01055 [Anaerolineales bacterium]|nr:hypothetical protein [Anaerolineales bacterium]